MSTALQAGSISLVRHRFLRASTTFADCSAVFDVVGERLRARLDLLTLQPKRVLDLGCRDGYQLAALRQRYPEAEIVGADPAPCGLVAERALTAGSAASPAAKSSIASRLRFALCRRWLGSNVSKQPRIACDPHQLPFADGSFDLVVSNLLLPWCHAPHLVFEEVSRVLAVDGAFMFSSAGPDTLREYRADWARIDQQIHSFGLLDMHDLGDALMQAKFAEPVLDRENLFVDYPDLQALEKELRHVGAANVALGRRQGLTSPKVVSALRQLARRSERYAVTLELLQGLAWKGLPAHDQSGNGAEYRIPVTSLKGSWKAGAAVRADN